MDLAAMQEWIEASRIQGKMVSDLGAAMHASQVASKFWKARVTRRAQIRHASKQRAKQLQAAAPAGG